jgi:outer membrane protein OmpA-like peptidoglycan-associated protein
MKQTFIIIILFALITPVIAQTKLANDGKFIYLKNGDLLQDAVFYYDEKDYETALPLYKALEQKYPDDVAFTYRLGVCYTYSKKEANKALEYLLKAQRIDSSISELNYYIGRAYYVNYAFAQAITYLNKFTTQYPQHPTTAVAKQLIEASKHGDVVLHQSNNNSIVFNADSAVNTVYAEYAPVVDDHKNTLYYTMRGDTNIVNGKHDKLITTIDYNENIMVQKGNTFVTPHSLAKPINSRKHDATLTYYNNKLYIYRDKKRRGSGDFFEVVNNKPMPLKGLNTKAWEGSATFFSNGRIVIFSSVRKQGKGGRDLYMAIQNGSGTWETLKAISTLNTELDEDAPYFDEATNTLYFSSKGHNSIGEFDVFKSKYSNGVFETPVNMGYPINSIADDIYYTKATNDVYYFASNRTGGFGSYDIYKACTNNRTAPYQGLTLLKGKIENAEANKLFKVYAQNPVTKTQELVGTFSANEFDNMIEFPIQSGVVYSIVPANKIDTSTTLKTLIVDLTTNTKHELNQTFDFTKPIIPTVVTTVKTIDTAVVVVKPAVKKAPTHFELKPIYFATNSSKVSTEQEQYLQAFANDLKLKHIPQLEIMGYTDGSGNDKLNTKLSQRRADAVAKLLRQYGAKVKYWSVKGNTVYPNCTGADEKCRVVMMNPVWD